MVDVVACTVQPAEFLQSALRGFQTQRQTTAQLRPGRAADAAADGGDDDEDDETAELLQCNLRAHDYRSQQLSRCDQTPPCTGRYAQFTPHARRDKTVLSAPCLRVK